MSILHRLDTLATNKAFLSSGLRTIRLSEEEMIEVFGPDFLGRTLSLLSHRLYFEEEGQLYLARVSHYYEEVFTLTEFHDTGDFYAPLDDTTLRNLHVHREKMKEELTKMDTFFEHPSVRLKRLFL